MHTYEIILEDGNKILLSANNIIDAIQYLAETGKIQWYDQVVAVKTR